MKNQALGESIWITQYGNEENGRLTFVFEHVTAYSEGPNQLFFINTRI